MAEQIAERMKEQRDLMQPPRHRAKVRDAVQAAIARMRGHPEREVATAATTKR
ncbi:hypothetical protein [Lichenicoccus roseus]|uniref:hypothetical protein n=1 Tax=Lichenicoccus roseus TaxID=2683649 RepID=UPI0014871A63|nr:hypothetical protein [Lichenicoccus roseus]